jgi:Holliday junction resolvase-like predicted endonuclease
VITSIKKRSGNVEAFSVEKVRHSLERSGISEKIIEKLLAEIEKEKPHTTEQLHHLIITNLNKHHHGSFAARYNLKTALFELGPAGFPFEQFIARLLQAMGFRTETDVTLQGRCVTHEVDVIAHREDISYLIECKFHNVQGITSNIKVPLYIQSRFNDIKEHHSNERAHTKIHVPWCVTNTVFSEQARAYAACQNMRMLDWHYPEHESLARLVDHYSLHPITALTTLSLREKQFLIQKGLILCKEASHFRHAFKELGFSDDHTHAIIEQAERVSTIHPRV